MCDNIGKARAKVLLMGASGRLGGMVLRHWRNMLSEQFDVVAQYRSIPTKSELPGPFVIWSLSENNTAQVLEQGPFKAMVMLGGVTPGPGKMLEDNLRLAEACLNIAQLAGISRVLIASSSAVYGAGDGAALAENAPLAPVNAYGKAKRTMENACATWQREHPNTNLCMLRIGNVVGADSLLLNLPKASGQPILLDTFADGRGPIRSYIGPVTLGDVLARLAVDPFPRGMDGLPFALNIAAPRPIAMESLANVLGYPVVQRIAPPSVAQYITLDCSLLEKFFPFEGDSCEPATMIEQWQQVAQ